MYVADTGLSEGLALASMGEPGDIGHCSRPATFAGSDYFVEDEDLGGGLHSLISTAVDGRRVMRLQAIYREPGDGDSFFQGIHALEEVSLQGNAVIDSYDSSLGTYDSQVVEDHANDNIRVISEGSIDLSSGSQIFGDLSWSGDPLDHAWISGSSLLTGTFGVTEDPPEPPAIEVPTLPSSGSFSVGRGETQVLTGAIHYDSIAIGNSGDLTIQGPAQIVVDSFVLSGGGTVTFDPTSGPIEIFALGDFVLSSNSDIFSSANDASLVSIRLLGEHEERYGDRPIIKFASNGSFFGTVLAPKINVHISSNFEFFGAVMSRWFTLSANTSFHFDENLRSQTTNSGDAPEVLAWRMTSGQQLETEGFRFSELHGRVFQSGDI